MTENVFNRLAPFIQEWIYAQEWEELRAIQVEAAKAIFDTPNHLLLATGTASGKTEAAIFPALTELYKDPSATIGILYISPLKALINDQFKRMEGLLEEADVPVWRWHGDVPQSLKTKLVKNPSGILQITPESMESLLLNKRLELRNMFGDLRFIVIDEVHVFMNSERGTQILCQLERLAEIILYHPRRIGLSATLGDYSSAEKWLASGTKVKVATPKIDGLNKKIRLAVEHFLNPNPSPSGINPPDDTSESFNLPLPSETYLFEQTLGKRCLIFTNSREKAESTITALRSIAKMNHYPDRYHVHHGSIAGYFRETTESIMKEDDTPVVTAATITLELGIDIGSLERILQIGSPRTVSSFLQRLGRSGRRNNISEILFVHTEEVFSDHKPLPYLIPWDFIQSIAIIQLYLEEKWIEPIHPMKSPLSLLYHQTLSILASVGELSSQALAQRILTLTPFSNVSQEEFRELLKYLVEIKHIQVMEDGGLILGLEGEKVVRNYRFYAVFQDDVEWIVKEGSKEIGKLGNILLPGERFPLAGYVWEVIEAYPKLRVMMVKKVGGRTRYIWPGDIGPVHTKVLQRMRKVLFEEDFYPYLQNGARERLYQARRLAQEVDLDQQVLFQLAEKKFCLFPWMGTIAYRTLDRILKFNSKELEITRLYGRSPYYIEFEVKIGTEEELEQKIKAICLNVESSEKLVDQEEQFIWQKYDKYLPLKLQQIVFMNDYLNLTEVKNIIKGW